MKKRLTGDELREHLRAKAKERWNRLTVEERLALRNRQKQGMRSYWESMSEEQKKEINRKRLATLAAKKAAKKKESKSNG